MSGVPEDPLKPYRKISGDSLRSRKDRILEEFIRLCSEGAPRSTEGVSAAVTKDPSRSLQGEDSWSFFGDKRGPWGVPWLSFIHQTSGDAEGIARPQYLTSYVWTRV